MTSTTETLQLEHLCGYLPYGLKMQIDWPNGNISTGLLKSIGLHPGIGGEDLLTIFVEIEKDNSRQFIFRKNQKKYMVKPLVIPLSELTREQWMEIFQAGIDNLKVPVPKHLLGDLHLELTDMAAELFTDFCNQVNDSISFYFVEKQFSTDLRFNQLAAFNKIYELHGDLHGLLEKGLALNKLTYEKRNIR